MRVCRLPWCRRLCTSPASGFPLASTPVVLLPPPANAVRLCPPKTASTNALPGAMSLAACTVLPPVSSGSILLAAPLLYPRWCVECTCESLGVGTPDFVVCILFSSSQRPRLLVRMPQVNQPPHPVQRTVQGGDILTHRDALPIPGFPRLYGCL